MTVSIVTLVGALFGLPAGGWSERVGHARALRIGILIMAGAAALCAAAADANMLLAARGLAGVGYVVVVVASPSLMVSSAEPRHHAFALSLWGTFVPAGIALSGIAAAAFADGAGWRIIFAVDVALLALGLIIAIVTIPQTRGPQHDERRGSAGALRAAAPLSVAFFCFGLVFLALAGLFPAYLVVGLGLPAAEGVRERGRWGHGGGLAARRQPRLDALFHRQQPRLAGDRHQTAVRIDGIEAHGHAVLHIAADRLEVAAALIGDDVAMGGGAVDASPRGARIGVAPGRSGGAGAHEIAGLGRIFVGRVQPEGCAAASLLVVVQRGELAALAAIARELPGGACPA